MKAGSIILWSGAIVDIPDRWVLCDGNNGTPDLRNKFVVGAGDTYAVGANGGAATHTHTFVGDGHSHELNGAPPDEIGPGSVFTHDTMDAMSNGTTEPGSTLPPYYALAYIMYLGV